MDKELLELAAKAAGIEVIGKMGNDGLQLFNGKHWNPLTDDGDSQRLAVKLCISVEHPNPADVGGGFVTASIHKEQYRYLFLERTWFIVIAKSEDFPGDLYAATRRAIVMAAAAIGVKK